MTVLIASTSPSDASLMIWKGNKFFSFLLCSYISVSSAFPSIIFLKISSECVRCSWTVLRTRFISLIISSSLISRKYERSITFRFLFGSTCNASAIRVSFTIYTNLTKMLASVTCLFSAYQQNNPQNAQERHHQKED